MGKYTGTVSVKFKKINTEHPENVLAVFPDEPWDMQGQYLTSYMHTGQHGSCSPDCLTEYEDATPEEYAALRDELVSIGYTLNIL